MNPAPRFLKSLFVMATMVEAFDPHTGGHLWRVSRFSRRLAELGAVSAPDVARIMLCGFLHDQGEIAAPDKVLDKTDRRRTAPPAARSSPCIVGKLMTRWFTAVAAAAKSGPRATAIRFPLLWRRR